MAIALFSIGHNTASAANTVSVTVPAGGVPSGVLICCGYVNNQTNPGARTRTYSDSASNSYSEVLVTANSAAGGPLAAITRAYNVAALSSGNTIQCVVSGSTINGTLSCFYATGCLSASDPHDSAADASSTGNSANPTITVLSPTVANSLGVVVIGVAGNNSDSFTNSTGWTTPPDSDGSTSGTVSSLRGGTKIISASETYTATIVSKKWALVSTAFKPLVSIVPSMPIASPFTMPGGFIVPPSGLLAGAAARAALDALRRNRLLTRREMMRWWR